MNSDAELLRRYAEGSEKAFTEFVQHHVNLVYAAALRRLGNDRQLAEEVTQTVFMQCASKAKALQHHPALSGWLHHSTRFAAIDALRASRRRQFNREIENMSDETSDSSRDLPWAEIRPLIDDLLDRLNHSDRDALVWRFFEECSFAQIAAKLRVSEDAARMRVDRALNKLRQAFSRRGFKSTSATLALALTQQTMQAAPFGLAGTVSSGALAAALAGGGTGFTAGTVLLMSKANLGLLSAIVVAGLTGVLVETRANLNAAEEVAGLQSKLAAESGLVRQNPVAGAVMPDPNAVELARLRARLAELNARPEGVVDSDIIPRSAWKDAGQATPAAALETYHWAIDTFNFARLIEISFGTAGKRETEAYFSTLSPESQSKYQKAELLFAPYLARYAPRLQVEGVEVIDLLEGNLPSEVMVRYWAQLANGQGQVITLPFRHVTDRWMVGTREDTVPFAVDMIQSHDPRLPSYPSAQTVANSPR